MNVKEEKRRILNQIGGHNVQLLNHDFYVPYGFTLKCMPDIQRRTNYIILSKGEKWVAHAFTHEAMRCIKDIKEMIQSFIDSESISYRFNDSLYTSDNTFAIPTTFP